MLEFLRTPERFARVGARMPSAVMLYGPPGTGKTLLARALAGEAGVPFFATSGSDFVELYVGVGAQADPRALPAREVDTPRAPSIFIDELDAIGKRARRRPRPDERRARPDPERAARRARRFRHELEGGLRRGDRTGSTRSTPRSSARAASAARSSSTSPTRRARRAILDVHANGKPIAATVSLDRIARTTAGSRARSSPRSSTRRRSSPSRVDRERDLPGATSTRRSSAC